MSIKIIKPTQIVAEVSAILTRLAIAIEHEPLAKLEHAAAVAEIALVKWMEPHEALILVGALVDERRRCPKCTRAASYTRCSGELCLLCAQQHRDEQETEMIQ